MIILFEDETYTSLLPLTEMRHCSELKIGTMSILEAIKKETSDEIAVWGRDYLSEVFMERTNLAYNERCEGICLLVNSVIVPKKETVERIISMKKGEALVRNGMIVAACVNASNIHPNVITRKERKEILAKCSKLFEDGSLLSNYWDFVRENGEIIKEQFRYYEPKERKDLIIKGDRKLIHVESSDIDPYVVIDTSNGPVIIEKEVIIEPFTIISGPTFIGKKTRVYSALIRGGTSIFVNCRIGGEVGNSIIYSFSNKPHHGYIGDAIVGEWVNIGDGCTFSNLKNTYGNARVSVSGKRVDTGMMKLGPLVSDMVKLSINGSVYGGRKIGVSCFVSGTLERDLGNFLFYRDGKVEKLRLEKVIEVQQRMMKRRGESLSEKNKKLIEYIYEMEDKKR
jgi:UDP-N-acetylglucosamine diphosphorylase/glucosamine-1-phosphate N-acetyltransferase